MSGHRRFGQSLDIGLDRNLHMDGQASYFLRNGRRALAIRIGDHDQRRPLGGETAAHGPADAARATGDHGNFVS